MKGRCIDINICVSGPDAVGKSTYVNKVAKKFGMNVIHSTAKTRNTLEYHLDLLDNHENTCFDRFSVGEMVFPKLYGREPKLTEEEFYKTLKRVEDNNDIYVLFTCSDVSILKNRLIDRGELDYLNEIEGQLVLYNEVAKKMTDFYKGYKNFYICDIAEPNAYDNLDKWTDEHFGKVTVNVAYKKVCKDLVEKGHVISSQNIRGGTTELCNYMFTIDDLDEDYVTLETGKSNLTYLAAETLWYMSNRNDVSFIGKFAKLWTLLSDDGKTNNSAYGYILQEKHGFNQIEKMIELLKHDPTSRRAVMNINVPNEHVIETKDEPCTIALVPQIRDNKLHMTAIMRSNDINFGFRNDILFFITIQKYIASKLNIEVGTYTHFASSIHFYAKDTKFIKDVAYGTMEKSKERLDTKKLLSNKEKYVSYIDNNFISKDDFHNLLLKDGIIYNDTRLC